MAVGFGGGVEQFQAGRALAGENALGVFAKNLLAQVGTVGEAQLKSRMDLEGQKQLIPLKEASAIRLQNYVLREKGGKIRVSKKVAGDLQFLPWGKDTYTAMVDEYLAMLSESKHNNPFEKSTDVDSSRPLTLPAWTVPHSRPSLIK